MCIFEDIYEDIVEYLTNKGYELCWSYVLLSVLAVMITVYQAKYQAQQQPKFLLILTYSSRTVQLLSG